MTLFSGYFWDFGYFQLQLNFSSQKLSDDFCALGKYFILPSMLSSFCLRSSLKPNKLCHGLSCVRCELVFLSESHCFNQVPVYSVQIDDDYAICFAFSSTVPECLRQSLITINPSAICWSRWISLPAHPSHNPIPTFGWRNFVKDDEWTCFVEVLHRHMVLH